MCYCVIYLSNHCYDIIISQILGGTQAGGGDPSPPPQYETLWSIPWLHENRLLCVIGRSKAGYLCSWKYICTSSNFCIYIYACMHGVCSLTGTSWSIQVDFQQLQMNTLRRYKRHYKLQLKPGTNKIQLVEVQWRLVWLWHKAVLMRIWIPLNEDVQMLVHLTGCGDITVTDVVLLCCYLQAISKHFKTIRVSEKKAVPLFISMVKSHKSKLDQPKPADTS